MLKHRLQRIESVVDRCGLQAQTRANPHRLQTVQDVIDLLQEQVEAVRAEPWLPTIDKARVLATLASVARKTIETGVLATRLEMLEEVLKQRQGDSHA